MRLFARKQRGEIIMLKRITALKSLAIALGLLITSLPSNDAHAHGGVSITDDSCVLKIGPYLFHFTGYQPETSQAEEFCEDIPLPGAAIVVLDHVDKILRKMQTDFRVIKDYKSLGNDAKIEELDGIEVLEQHTVFYKKPALYPRGTINVEHNFEKGRYIGMVTVKDPSTNKEFTSIFPFSVGYTSTNTMLKYAGYILLILIGFGAVYYFVVHKHKDP